ncbi:porin [Janthinobacterium sp. HLX7-2]|uniref:porin n=1 Tax=Janthinobacterium sp. HLX7-2 TaxID=1259331 RepID=UPI003F20E9C3
MKKKLMAAAASAAISQLAWGQSNVTVYGMLDAGLAFESGNKAGSITKVGSGIAGGSRLGFKGTEDLGGGTKALFVIESGLQVDTGASGQGGLAFGRQSFVGISNEQAGTLTLGRQYAPHYLATVFADPFSSGTSADEKNLITAVSDGGRMSNSIKYASPQWKGFSGEAAYSAGEIAGDSTAGRAAGFAIAYDAAPLSVRVAWHNKNNDTTTTKAGSARNTFLAATYAFPLAKLYLAYGINKGLFSSTLRNSANPYGYAEVPTAASLTDDSTDALVGVAVPLGAHTLLASWIHKDDKTAANRDADQLGLGYRYTLSQRTNLYAVYARMRNKNGASYTLGNASDGGSGDRAVSMGMQHAF